MDAKGNPVMPGPFTKYENALAIYKNRTKQRLKTPAH
jgi:hypothetical protein